MLILKTLFKNLEHGLPMKKYLKWAGLRAKNNLIWLFISYDKREKLREEEYKLYNDMRKLLVQKTVIRNRSKALKKAKQNAPTKKKLEKESSASSLSGLITSEDFAGVDVEAERQIISGMGKDD